MASFIIYIGKYPKSINTRMCVLFARSPTKQGKGGSLGLTRTVLLCLPTTSLTMECHLSTSSSSWFLVIVLGISQPFILSPMSSQNFAQSTFFMDCRYSLPGFLAKCLVSTGQ